MKYLVLVICLSLSLSTYARPSKLANYLTISEELQNLLTEKSSTDELPRVSDKNVVSLVEKLLKSQIEIKAEKYTVNDFGSLLEVCGRANKFGMTYMLDRLSSVIEKNDSADVIQVKLAKLMSENSLKYQHELEIFYPFLLDCLAIQSSLIDPFWNSLPIDQRTQVRINGIKQMQTGVLQIYAGVLINLSDSNVEASFKDSLLKSALDSAPIMSSILSLDKRNVVLEHINHYKKITPAKYLTAFKTIYKEFDSKQCSEVCQL